MGSAHCAALAQLVDCCEFVSVSDIRQEQARTAADRYKVVSFLDYREMFDRVDGVIVATPPDSHREVVVAAAEAGKHVFVEKPLAKILEDCDAMIAACDQANVLLMVGQVLRFYPVHELGRQLVDAGVTGDTIYMEADYAGPYRGTRERPTSWYGSIGGLLENGIHKADLINWFGGDALHVAGERGSFSGHDDWEDYSVTLIRYRAGALGILRWGGFLGSRRSTDTIIDGTKGSLRLSIDTGNVYRKLVSENEWTELVPDGKGENSVERELRHFVASLEKGTKCRVDGREGRRAVELVLASYKASDLGTRVTMPLQY
jgi:predicted dehydrogenase